MLPLYEGKSPGSIAAKRLENQKRLGIVPPSAKLGMHNKFNPAGYEKTSAERKEYIAECMATYAAQISIMDRGIGKILESLDRHHLSGNTIVMFLSDNGATAEMPQNTKTKNRAAHRPAGGSRLPGRLRPHVGGRIQHALPPVQD